MVKWLKQFGGFLAAIGAVLVALFVKEKRDIKKGQDKQKQKQQEQQNENIEKANQVRDDLRSDDDYRHRVRERFTRDE